MPRTWLDDLTDARPAPPGAPLAPPIIVLGGGNPIIPVSPDAPSPLAGVTSQPSAGQAGALDERGKVQIGALDTVIRTLPVNQTTPSVKGANVWKVANTAATIITNFVDAGDGQRITLIFTDASTSITSSTTVRIGSSFASTADDTMELIYDLTVGAWYRLGQQAN